MKYTYLRTLETDYVTIEIFAFDEVDLIFAHFGDTMIQIEENVHSFDIMDEIMDTVGKTCTEADIIHIFSTYYCDLD